MRCHLNTSIFSLIVWNRTLFEQVSSCLSQVEKTVWDWELMNDIKPIWQRQAKEVEEEEYTAFYKTFSKVGPLTPIHVD